MATEIYKTQYGKLFGADFNDLHLGLLKEKYQGKYRLDRLKYLETGFLSREQKTDGFHLIRRINSQLL